MGESESNNMSAERPGFTPETNRDRAVELPVLGPEDVVFMSRDTMTKGHDPTRELFVDDKHEGFKDSAFFQRIENLANAARSSRENESNVEVEKKGETTVLEVGDVGKLPEDVRFLLLDNEGNELNGKGIVAVFKTITEGAKKSPSRTTERNALFAVVDKDTTKGARKKMEKWVKHNVKKTLVESRTLSFPSKDSLDAVDVGDLGSVAEPENSDSSDEYHQASASPKEDLNPPEPAAQPQDIQPPDQVRESVPANGVSGENDTPDAPGVSGEASEGAGKKAFGVSVEDNGAVQPESEEVPAAFVSAEPDLSEPDKLNSEELVQKLRDGELSIADAPASNENGEQDEEGFPSPEYMLDSVEDSLGVALDRGQRSRLNETLEELKKEWKERKSQGVGNKENDGIFEDALNNEIPYIMEGAVPEDQAHSPTGTVYPSSNGSEGGAEGGESVVVQPRPPENQQIESDSGSAANRTGQNTPVEELESTGNPVVDNLARDAQEKIQEAENFVQKVAPRSQRQATPSPNEALESSEPIAIPPRPTKEKLSEMSYAQIEEQREKLREQREHFSNDDIFIDRMNELRRESEERFKEANKKPLFIFRRNLISDINKRDKEVKKAYRKLNKELRKNNRRPFGSELEAFTALFQSYAPPPKKVPHRLGGVREAWAEKYRKHWIEMARKLYDKSLMTPMPEWLKEEEGQAAGGGEARAEVLESRERQVALHPEVMGGGEKKTNNNEKFYDFINEAMDLVESGRAKVTISQRFKPEEFDPRHNAPKEKKIRLKYGKEGDDLVYAYKTESVGEEEAYVLLKLAARGLAAAHLSKDFGEADLVSFRTGNGRALVLFRYTTREDTAGVPLGERFETNMVFEVPENLAESVQNLAINGGSFDEKKVEGMLAGKLALYEPVFGEGKMKIAKPAKNGNAEMATKVENYLLGLAEVKKLLDDKGNTNEAVKRAREYVEYFVAEQWPTLTGDNERKKGIFLKELKRDLSYV